MTVDAVRCTNVGRTPSDEVRVRRMAYVAAFAVWFGYLAVTPRTTLWDRDEARFGRAAVEMVQSGQYLYPTFNGEVRAQKPILTYWLMALSVTALGPREIAVRFWSPAAMALAAFFVFLISRRLFDARTGVRAMLVFALNPLALVEGTAATADALLLVCVTGAMTVFTYAMRACTARHVLGMTAAIAAAMYAKGPVGLVLPLLIMAGAAWGGDGAIPRRTRLLRAGGLAAAASVLLFAMWAVPANAATDGRFLSFGLGREVLWRAVTPLEAHGGSLLVYLPFYLGVVVFAFAPWTAYLPAALQTLAKGDGWPRDGRALITSWLTLPFLVFTLAATKLPHYILPIWPALAIAVAGLVHLEERDALAPTARAWLARGVWINVALLCAAWIALAWAAMAAPAPGVHTAAIALAVVSFSAAVYVWTAYRAGRYGPALMRTAIGTAAVCGVGIVWLAPSVEALKPVGPVAREIRRQMSPTAPIYTYVFDEPSLVFYLSPASVTPFETHDALIEWARSEAPGVLVTTRADLQPVLAYAGPLPIDVFASGSGMNYSKGRSFELIALRKASR